MFYSMKGTHVITGWPDQRTLDGDNLSPMSCKKGWFLEKIYKCNGTKITEEAFKSAWKIRVWVSDTGKEYTFPKNSPEFPVGDIQYEKESFASLDTPCHQTVMKRNEYYCSPVALAAIAAVGVAVSPVMLVLVVATSASLLNRAWNQDDGSIYLKS